MRRSFMGISGLAVLLFLPPALYGLDFSITGREAGIAVMPEYNRNFSTIDFALALAASGSLEFNERYTLKGGFAWWKTSTTYEIDAAAGVTVKPIRKLPLYAYLSYMFNTLPEYEADSHTILSLIGYQEKYAGIALGTNLRFSSFFGEPAIFESILAFAAYVNFYNTEKFRIGLRCANFSDFAAGNFGAYYLSLNSTLGLTKLLSLANDLEFHQIGSGGLSANLQSIAYKAGVVFTW